MLPSGLAYLIWVVPMMFSTCTPKNTDVPTYRYEAEITYKNTLASPVVENNIYQPSYDRRFYFSSIDIQFNCRLYFNSNTDYAFLIDNLTYNWGYMHENASDEVFWTWSNTLTFNPTVYYQSNIADLKPQLLFLQYFDGATDYAYRYCQLYNDGEEVYDLQTYTDSNFYNSPTIPNFECIYEFNCDYLRQNILTYIDTYLRYDEGYFYGQQYGELVGSQNGNAEGYASGYDAGYEVGVADGSREAYAEGYTDGYNDGYSTDSTAATIFTGIAEVGLLPVNVFLAIFNFEVFGINIGGFVASLLTVAIIVIIIRVILAKSGGGKN